MGLEDSYKLKIILVLNLKVLNLSKSIRTISSTKHTADHYV